MLTWAELTTAWVKLWLHSINIRLCNYLKHSLNILQLSVVFRQIQRAQGRGQSVALENNISIYLYDSKHCSEPPLIWSHWAGADPVTILVQSCFLASASRPLLVYRLWVRLRSHLSRDIKGAALTNVPHVTDQGLQSAWHATHLSTPADGGKFILAISFNVLLSFWDTILRLFLLNTGRYDRGINLSDGRAILRPTQQRSENLIKFSHTKFI